MSHLVGIPSYCEKSNGSRGEMKEDGVAGTVVVVEYVSCSCSLNHMLSRSMVCARCDPEQEPACMWRLGGYMQKKWGSGAG